MPSLKPASVPTIVLPRVEIATCHESKELFYAKMNDVWLEIFIQLISEMPLEDGSKGSKRTWQKSVRQPAAKCKVCDKSLADVGKRAYLFGEFEPADDLFLELARVHLAAVAGKPEQSSQSDGGKS